MTRAFLRYATSWKISSQHWKFLFSSRLVTCLQQVLVFRSNLRTLQLRLSEVFDEQMFTEWRITVHELSRIVCFVNIFTHHLSSTREEIRCFVQHIELAQAKRIDHHLQAFHYQRTHNYLLLSFLSINNQTFVVRSFVLDTFRQINFRVIHWIRTSSLSLSLLLILYEAMTQTTWREEKKVCIVCVSYHYC